MDCHSNFAMSWSPQRRSYNPEHARHSCRVEGALKYRRAWWNKCAACELSATLLDRALNIEGAPRWSKKAKKTIRREGTKADIKELKAHSKARTPVAKISKATKRSVGALRQKALNLGIGLQHQR
ncbi:hypothetical protein ABIB85_008490 [Bradyrhizobium sp. JR1.5]